MSKMSKKNRKSFTSKKVKKIIKNMKKTTSKRGKKRSTRKRGGQPELPSTPRSQIRTEPLQNPPPLVRNTPPQSQNVGIMPTSLTSIFQNMNWTTQPNTEDGDTDEEDMSGGQSKRKKEAEDEMSQDTSSTDETSFKKIRMDLGTMENDDETSMSESMQGNTGYETDDEMDTNTQSSSSSSTNTDTEEMEMEGGRKKRTTKRRTKKRTSTITCLPRISTTVRECFLSLHRRWKR
jgi:hypothetical protein